MTITKDELEKYIYVATSSHSEIFESIEPHFYDAETEIEDDILGSVGVAAVEADTTSDIYNRTKKYVCIKSFLDVFRQLDLTLTPTGFGVVSNDNVAPASKARVDALEESLIMAEIKAKSELITACCKISGWGAQQVAAECVDNILFRYDDMVKYSSVEIKNSSDVRMARIKIADADGFLRLHLSDSLIDNVLSEIRTDSVSADNMAILRQLKICHGLWISGDIAEFKNRYHRLITTIEADETKYQLYWNSDAYKINHSDNWTNTKDNSAFFFVG